MIYLSLSEVTVCGLSCTVLGKGLETDNSDLIIHDKGFDICLEVHEKPLLKDFKQGNKTYILSEKKCLVIMRKIGSREG